MRIAINNEILIRLFHYILRMAFNIFKKRGPGEGNESNSRASQRPDETKQKNLRKHFSAALIHATEIKKETDFRSSSFKGETFESNSQALDTHLENAEALLENAEAVRLEAFQEIKNIKDEFEQNIETIKKGRKEMNREDFYTIRNEMSKKLERVDEKVGKVKMQLQPYRANGPYRNSYKKEPFKVDEIYLRDNNSTDQFWDLETVISDANHLSISSSDKTRAEVLSNKFTTLKKEFTALSGDFFVFSQVKWNFDRYHNNDIRSIAEIEHTVS